MASGDILHVVRNAFSAINFVLDAVGMIKMRKKGNKVQLKKQVKTNNKEKTSYGKLWERLLHSNASW